MVAISCGDIDKLRIKLKYRIKYDKRRVNLNNKPNYTKGKTRYQILNLLHITGTLTPRSLKIFDNSKTVMNTMSKLRKENIIEKVHNKTVFDSLSTTNYKDNLEKYFQRNIPETNLEYFEKYTKKNINRAKYDTTGTKLKRQLKDSEIIAIMYAAGIPTLPDDKIMVVQNGTITDNVYYMSREIREYSGFEPDVRYLDTEEQDKLRKINNSVVETENGFEFYDKGKTLIASRVNGTLLTAGENYNIYNLGKDINIWSVQGEYKLRNYIENMLANYINKNSYLIESAILFVYNLNIIEKLIEPNKTNRKSYEGLSMTYKNIYVLPFDKYGKEMIRIMSEPDWKVRMYENIMEETYKDTSMVDTVCDFYDGEVYTFVFCVPNFARYIQFLKKAMFVKQQHLFRVICFDFQCEFVYRTANQYAKILKADFDEFLNDWKILSKCYD